jgi:hypothetical protein
MFKQTETAVNVRVSRSRSIVILSKSIKILEGMVCNTMKDYRNNL